MGLQYSTKLDARVKSPTDVNEDVEKINYYQ
jgi:hypothetical protein